MNNNDKIINSIYKLVNTYRNKSFYCSNQCILRNTKHIFFDIVGDYNKCKVIFIGINPGKDEVIKGKPFVGASGKILRETCQNIGLNNYIIMNCIFGHTLNTNQSGFKEKWKEVLAKCSLFSKPILFGLNNIKIIVPLGEIPLYFIKLCFDGFNYEGIRYSKMNNFGIFQCYFGGKYNRYRIISIPHPSYIVRRKKAELQNYHNYIKIIKNISDKEVE